MRRPWRRRAAGGLMALGALLAAPPALAWSAATARGEETSPTTLLPPITVPPVTVPVTVPPVSLPPISVPNVDLPPVTLPPVSLPPVTLPGLEVPPLTLPAGRDGSGPVPADRQPGGAGATGPPGTTARTAPAGADRVSAGSDAGAPAARPVGRTGTREPRPALPLRLRRAGVDTARQLSVPIGLVLALAGFLLFQGRVDRSDPRVAAQGELHDDDLLEFS